MRWKSLIIGLIAGLTASPAPAATVLKAVPAALSPDKAYAVVEIREYAAIKGGGGMPGNLVLARYDSGAGDVRGGTRAQASALPNGISPRITITDRSIAKAKDSRLYLLELEPDEWVIEGTAGTAFSLGSLRFTLQPGQLVDLGVLSPSPDWREGEGAETVGNMAAKAILFGAFAKKRDPVPAMLEVRRRGAADIALPAGLAAKGVQPAAYSPGARFGNYLGGLVNRIDGHQGRPDASAPSS